MVNKTPFLKAIMNGKRLMKNLECIENTSTWPGRKLMKPEKINLNHTYDESSHTMCMDARSKFYQLVLPGTILTRQDVIILEYYTSQFQKLVHCLPSEIEDWLER